MKRIGQQTTPTLALSTYKMKRRIVVACHKKKSFYSNAKVLEVIVLVLMNVDYEIWIHMQL